MHGVISSVQFKGGIVVCSIAMCWTDLWQTSLYLKEVTFFWAAHQFFVLIAIVSTSVRVIKTVQEGNGDVEIEQLVMRDV